MDALIWGKTKYTHCGGTPALRDRLSKELLQRKGLRYDPSQIVVTSGAKQAVVLGVMILLERGQEAVLLTPTWVSYEDAVVLAGGTPVAVRRKQSDGFKLDVAAVAQSLNKRTKLIILCNPCNPSGACYTREELEELAAVLRREEHRHVHVLSDEIYSRITYDGATHTSFAALDGMYERTLTIDGVSKSLGMTGFRIGYCAAPAHLAEEFLKLQALVAGCPCSISQEGVRRALDCGDCWVAGNVVDLERKRDIALEILNQATQRPIPAPQGAFYILIPVSHHFGKVTGANTRIDDAADFAVALLEEAKVATTPGDDFGAPECIRISYAGSESTVRGGCDAICHFLRGLRGTAAAPSECDPQQ